MFNFFWSKLRDDWVLSAAASRLFAASAAIIVVMTALLVADVARTTDALGQVLWSVLGVLLGFSIFFLWSGMLRFWGRFDPSSRWPRRIWLGLMIAGFWYGSVLYYLAVYLRLRRKPLVPLEGIRVQHFRTIVLLLWAALLISSGAILAFPRLGPYIHGRIFIPALMIIVFMTTAVYGIARACRGRQE
jgi:hypothetical protein